MQSSIDVSKLRPDVLDIYLKGIAEGYARALQSAPQKPYLELADVMERYGVGETKAYDIIRAIRRHCNGGMLNSAGKVMLSEAIAWESSPEVKFKARI